MPIVSINFSTSQENVNKIGLRSWKKFGAEYQLIEGENLETAKKVLKDFVYESLKKQPEELPETVQVIDKQEEPQSTEAKIIAQIYDITDVKVLGTFALLASKDREKNGDKSKISAAYQQQLEKLSKNT